MKKFIAVLFTVFVLLSLCSCGSKEDDKEHVEWLDEIPELPEEEVYELPEDMYGMWEPVKVLSNDGSFSEDVMESTLKKMKENKSIFKMELGNPSFMLNANDDGIYEVEAEIILDFDKGYAYYTETGQRIAPIELVDGQIYVTDTTNALTVIYDREA